MLTASTAQSVLLERKVGELSELVQSQSRELERLSSPERAPSGEERDTVTNLRRRLAQQQGRSEALAAELAVHELRQTEADLQTPREDAGAWPDASAEAELEESRRLLSEAAALGAAAEAGLRSEQAE